MQKDDISTREGAKAVGLRSPIAPGSQRKKNNHEPRDLTHEPLWERQPGENGPSFAAFAAYRDFGRTRTLMMLERAHGIKINRSWRAAKRWRWSERAAAWDAHLDRIQSAEAASKAREAGERHAKIASQHIATLLAPVAELARRINTGTLALDKVKDSDLVRMVQRNGATIRTLAELERLSVGLPSTTQAQVGANGLGPLPPAGPTTVVDALRSILAESESEEGGE